MFLGFPRWCHGHEPEISPNVMRYGWMDIQWQIWMTTLGRWGLYDLTSWVSIFKSCILKVRTKITGGTSVRRSSMKSDIILGFIRNTWKWMWKLVSCLNHCYTNTICTLSTEYKQTFKKIMTEIKQNLILKLYVCLVSSCVAINGKLLTQTSIFFPMKI